MAAFAITLLTELPASPAQATPSPTAAAPAAKTEPSQTEEMYKTLAEKLPGYEVEVTAHDKAEDKFIVMASNDRTPGTRNLFDAKIGTLTKLVEVAPWLPEKQLAPMKPIQYQSRDGLTIHGYLTLPLGREAKNLPVVDNEGHGFHNEENRFEFYEAMEKFLGKHLKPVA